jgi:hypothetical protein
MYELKKTAPSLVPTYETSAIVICHFIGKTLGASAYSRDCRIGIFAESNDRKIAGQVPGLATSGTSIVLAVKAHTTPPIAQAISTRGYCARRVRRFARRCIPIPS